jgi:hypothetical protein
MFSTISSSLKRKAVKHPYPDPVIHQEQDRISHRVDRVLSFFSSRRNWDSPNPSPAGECASPPPVLGGGAHSLAREGLGSPNSDEGTCGTLHIYVPYFVGYDLTHDMGWTIVKIVGSCFCSDLVDLPFRIKEKWTQYRYPSCRGSQRDVVYLGRPISALV